MTRLWILPNKISYRTWTYEEYSKHNPNNSIIEKVPHIICEKCGMDLGTGNGIAPIYVYCNHCKSKNFHPYKYKKIKTELKCLEYDDIEIDGIIIPYTKIYD